MYLFLIKTWLKTQCWLVKLQLKVYSLSTAPITDYHKCSSLKLKLTTVTSCSESHKIKLKVFTRLALTCRLCGSLFQTSSVCWQNLVACSCRVEVPTFLKAVVDQSQFLETAYISWFMASFTFKASNSGSLFILQISLTSPSASSALSSQRKFSGLKL